MFFKNIQKKKWNSYYILGIDFIAHIVIQDKIIITVTI